MAITTASPTKASHDACLASVDVVITPEIEAAINAVHQVHQNPAP